MPGPAASRRFPRERFTRSLEALCQQLDACHEGTFDYAPPTSVSRWSGAIGKIKARVRGLWAFGSWARGALECGDLDLVVDIEYAWYDSATKRLDSSPTRGAGYLPGFDAVRRMMIPSRPHVNFLDYADIVKLEGTGDRVVSLADLVPIWHVGGQLGEAIAWNFAIGRIKPDPKAGRSARTTDALPLRLDQTAMDLTQALEAVQAHADGLLAWQFRTHGEHRLETAAPLDAEWELLDRLALDCADAPLVQRAVAATRDVRKACSHVTYWFGDCGIWPTMLVDRQTDAIVITPSWTQRGPNGSLVVTPGNAVSARAASAQKERR